MRFNVAQQLKEAIGTERIYAVEEVFTSEEGQQYPIKGTVELLRTKGGILVKARLGTMAEGICSRCLEQFKYPVTLEMEEEFISTAGVDAAAPSESSETEAHFTLQENQLLDLGEAARQYQILARPMKPLCRANCAGLCPQCGANLNMGPCSCPSAATDARWNTLKALLVKEE